MDQLMSENMADNERHRRRITSLGLLTKTLAPTPVVRWILPARIRHKNKDDLVIVGEDFVQIAQIDQDHRLNIIATKADFDCTIISAKVLGDATEEDDDDLDFNNGIKIENDEKEQHSFPASTRLPPQCLVLALAKQQLVFMFACEDSEGSVTFAMSSSVPLPAFPSLPQQLGKHLAIDHRSRAIAVAASEDNVIVYSAEPINPTAQWGAGYLPISQERPLTRVRGTILQMDFLYPPEADPDHVILLLVVLKDGKTCLVRIDWLHSAGVQSAQKHKPYPISRGFPLPNLLIPVTSSAAFILASRSEILLYTDILTGHVQTPIPIDLPESEPKRPGSTADLPRWVAWARPRRTQGSGSNNNEYLYLAREDGAVYYVVLNRDTPAEGAYSTHVKDFGCFIDTGFACYGTRKQNDVFAIMGDMSQGGVYNIVPLPISPLGMDSDLVSILPNWTPTFDLISSKLPRNMDGTARSCDGLFATGGRQPYGRLSELRFGIEACASGRFQADMLSSIVRLWPLPLEEREEMLILMTSPTDSRVIQVPPGALLKHGEGEILEVEGDNGIDLSCRTLAAAVIDDKYVLQITESGWSVSHNGWSGISNEKCPIGCKISAAAIDEEHGIAVNSVRRNGQSFINLFAIQIDQDGMSLESLGEPNVSDKDIISVAIFESSAGMFVVLGSSDASLSFYGLDPQRGAVFITHHVIAGTTDSSKACDDMTVLSDHRPGNSTGHHMLMLICGLRNGDLYAFDLSICSEGQLSVLDPQRFSLGFTSVKVSPDPLYMTNDTEKPLYVSAYASCGNGFFKVKWDSSRSRDLVISNVWITDAKDPSLQQGAVSAFAVVPPSEYLIPQLASCLLLTSADGAFFTKVAGETPKVVPRSMSVQGTPNRAMYSHNYGCFITTGVETNLHPSPTSRGPRARYTQPVVHFKSSGAKKWEFVHRLEPGTRIYSLIEWVYRDPSGKKYPYILVGSGPDSLSSVKGEVTLLHPILRDGVVQEVRARRAKSLETAVYSLASYGERGLVVCTRPWLYLFEYHLEGSRFVEVCKYRFTSPGVFVTASPPMIHVSTAEDSLITLVHNPQDDSLTAIATDFGSRKTAHHLTVDISSPLATSSSSQSTSNGSTSAMAALNIFSTKDCRLVGKIAPSATQRSFTTTIPDLFRATLPRSQVRLRHANIRPPWRVDKVPGIIEDRIVGTSTDGTITGFAILDSGLANRLRWVQRLCERSIKICVMAPHFTLLEVDRELDEDEALVLPPPGFEGDVATVRRMARPEDMHVDGDVLQRLLDRGGATLLTEIVKEEVNNKDRLSDWVRNNMDAQLGLVDSLIVEVKQTLDRWW